MAKILLIEPTSELAQIYAEAMTIKGHEVRWVTSAQGAIDSTDKRRPDLIMLELELTTHNGIEFLYELRSYRDWQKIPVVILSHVMPAADSKESDLWPELGVVDYLYKPATKLATLLEVIEKQLTSQKRQTVML